MMYDELKAWAKSLTPEQLTAALYEMRERGAAVAYYDANEIATMYDGDDEMAGVDFEEIMEGDRDTLESVMCDAARQYVEGRANG